METTVMRNESGMKGCGRIHDSFDGLQITGSSENVNDRGEASDFDRVAGKDCADSDNNRVDGENECNHRNMSDATSLERLECPAEPCVVPAEVVYDGGIKPCGSDTDEFDIRKSVQDFSAFQSGTVSQVRNGASCSKTTCGVGSEVFANGSDNNAAEELVSFYVRLSPSCDDSGLGTISSSDDISNSPSQQGPVIEDNFVSDSHRTYSESEDSLVTGFPSGKNHHPVVLLSNVPCQSLFGPHIGLSPETPFCDTISGDPFDAVATISSASDPVQLIRLTVSEVPESEESRKLDDILLELNHLGAKMLRESSSSSDVMSSPIPAGGSSDAELEPPRRSSLLLLDDEVMARNKRYDRRSVTSVCSDSRIDARSMGCAADAPASASPPIVASSRSTEKIISSNRTARGFYATQGNCGIVRSSRSQETYFDSGDNMTCVDIDLDDNIASSVDALHYDSSSIMSLESMGGGVLIGGSVGDWSNDHLEMVDLPEDCVAEISCLQGWKPSTNQEDSNGVDILIDNKEFDTPQVRVALDEASHVVQAPVSMKRTLLERQNVNKTPSVTTDKPTATDFNHIAPHFPHLDFHSERTHMDSALSTTRSDWPQHGIAITMDERDAAELFEDITPARTADNVSIVNKSLLSDMSLEASKSTDSAGKPSHFTSFETEHVFSASAPVDPDLCSTKSSVVNTVFSVTPEEDNEDVSSGLEKGSEGGNDEVKEDGGEVDKLVENGVYRGPSSKEVDRPSAARLAKRLFFLHGFKKSDVSRHLSKKNSFAQLVGEEYLKFFDFTDEQLPSCLRRFIKQLILSADTQDRERLLAHFASRYHECNPGLYKSQDSCHTLACAMLLLNNDLHGQNMGRRMTLAEFITNLADMNDGDEFPREVLKMLYLSIKNQPLEIDTASGEEGDAYGTGSSGTAQMQSSLSGQSRAGAVGSMSSPNSVLLQAPDSNGAAEYKKGYIMKKSCVEPEGRKTPLGKRGWKMYYATLRDMVLYLHTDEHGLKRNAGTQFGNSVHIHHSLAIKATDYIKKNHVFRLQTADMAQHLVQTSDSKECQEWIDSINFVAATYSAPCQLGAAPPGSQRHFQRHLLPSAYTKLNLREQLSQHEAMVQESERELSEHRKQAPDKGARSRLIHHFLRKENYLKFELKRYRTYVRLLQYKLAAFPELEPSLAEIAIGEVDEPLSTTETSNYSEDDVTTSNSSYMNSDWGGRTTGGVDGGSGTGGGTHRRSAMLDRYTGRNSAILSSSPMTLPPSPTNTSRSVHQSQLDHF